MYTENIIIEDNKINIIKNIELNENLLNERNNAINKICSDVDNVNQIFNDLALLVTQQESNLDNIEQNITNSTIHIEKGKNIIIKINKKDKKKDKCMCNTIYFCLIINLIVFVLLIIKIILKK